jgi:hypothetical protein
MPLHHVLRMVPLPRTFCAEAEKQDHSRDAASHPSFGNHDAHEEKELPPKKGGGAPIGAPSMSAHCRQARELAQLICCAAAALIAGRSPFGAPPRHSPGRTHPPLAQLQFPRFLRPELTGVTRFALSRVYRAPRRPVVMPAERWPRAARERFARPRAGTALAPHLDRIRNAPFDERDSSHYVSKMGTNVKNTSPKMKRAPSPSSSPGLTRRSMLSVRKRGGEAQRTTSSHKSRHSGSSVRIRSSFHARDQCLMFFSR